MLTVSDISKSFNTLPVLEHITFHVNHDEIVAVIGPSGCGKSTLLNIISGLCTADQGFISGADNAIACVFQDDRLLPWRTVWENISLVGDTEEPDRIHELINAVGLKGFENYYPGQLSGGMKKRCGIARAFYYRSGLLLLDEPFQGLDYCLRREMLQMLLRVWKEHKQSVLFVTHEIDEALTAASRIIVLSDRPGKIAQEFDLPEKEGRNPISSGLNKIRQEIIKRITS
ncbi:MAG: ABC transporter ATP-binding protein [Clostridia bacterium BRH_c25]|nr:MAG: ABC transporter ATP-binding protein [Clostridia bacterium BRH_c25]